MSAGNVMGLVIVTFVALVMVSIGYCQLRKKDVPVGFYNVIDPPKKEEISDIIAWNKKHGIIWIVYGICIELGFLIGCVMTAEVLQMLFMMGGIVFPLPVMIYAHTKLEKTYRIVRQN